MSVSPEFIRRLVAMYRVPNQAVAYRPESAAWSAPCPHCTAEADWWSGKTVHGLQYKMACPLCGEVEWLAHEAAR